MQCVNELDFRNKKFILIEYSSMNYELDWNLNLL